MSKPNTKNPRSPKPAHLQLVPSAPVEVSAPRKPRLRWLLGGATAALVLAGAGGAAWWWSGRGSDGAADIASAMPAPLPHAEALLAFDVFAHTNSDPTMARVLHDDDAVRPNDGFTFVLYNRTGGSAYFMLFAIDSKQQFFWFYPEGDASKTNQSLPLAASAVSTIPEGVTPNVAPGAMKIVGVFSPKPLTLNDVQSAYAQGGFEAIRTSFSGSLVQVQAVDVGAP